MVFSLKSNRFTLYKKHNNSWKFIRGSQESPRASLVQVDGGQAVDVVHLLERDVQFGAQYRGGAGLLRRRQNLLSLLCEGVQVIL